MRYSSGVLHLLNASGSLYNFIQGKVRDLEHERASSKSSMGGKTAA